MKNVHANLFLLDSMMRQGWHNQGALFTSLKLSAAYAGGVKYVSR
jgi:hypothetical protein